MKKLTTIDQLRNLSEELRDSFKVKSLKVFGSFARGEESAASDIDILVELSETADLLDFIRLAEFLERRLGRKVDLVTERALKAELRDGIMSEALSI
ncbi:MAG: nucleotidyltransferase family protein [Deltaproteobacteria bacterium]|nr:nucleotidyltransferase family protein [Deltaproteobacteria bacterium]